MKEIRPPFRQLAGIVVSLLLVLTFAAAMAASQKRDAPLDQRLPTELVEKALADCCPVRLHLLDPSDPRVPLLVDGGDPHGVRDGKRIRRGMVLTPYLRVLTYSDSVWRASSDDEQIEALVRPELWVVAFPYSRDRARALLGDPSEWNGDPLRRLEPGRVPAGEEVFWPRSIRLRVLGEDERWIEPLWSVTDTFPYSAGITDEWVPKHSVVAAFPLSDPAVASRGAQIVIEGVERREDGRSWEDTRTFRLGSFSNRDWSRALSGRKRR